MSKPPFNRNDLVHPFRKETFPLRSNREVKVFETSILPALDIDEMRQQFLRHALLRESS